MFRFLFLSRGSSVASIWILAQTCCCFGCPFTCRLLYFPTFPLPTVSPAFPYTSLIIWPLFISTLFLCVLLSRLSGFPWDCTFPSFETGGGIRLQGTHRAHTHTHTNSRSRAAPAAQHHSSSTHSAPSAAEQTRWHRAAREPAPTPHGTPASRANVYHSRAWTPITRSQGPMALGVPGRRIANPGIRRFLRKTWEGLYGSLDPPYVWVLAEVRTQYTFLGLRREFWAQLYVAVFLAHSDTRFCSSRGSIGSARSLVVLTTLYIFPTYHRRDGVHDRRTILRSCIAWSFCLGYMEWAGASTGFIGVFVFGI